MGYPVLRYLWDILSSGTYGISCPQVPKGYPVLRYLWDILSSGTYAKSNRKIIERGKIDTPNKA
jgi:hypothetical protein